MVRKESEFTMYDTIEDAVKDYVETLSMLERKTNYESVDTCSSSF